MVTLYSIYNSKCELNTLFLMGLLQKLFLMSSDNFPVFALWIIGVWLEQGRRAGAQSAVREDLDPVAEEH